MGLTLNSLILKLGMNVVGRIVCRTGMPLHHPGVTSTSDHGSSLRTSAALVKTLILIVRMLLWGDLNPEKN